MANSHIIDELKKKIETLGAPAKAEKIGRVMEVKDGIIRISGLSNASSQEMLKVETSQGEISAIAFNLEEESIGGIVLGEYKNIRENDVVKGTGRTLSVRVGEEIIGRVVDAIGEPIDGKGSIFSAQSEEIYYPVERNAPSVIDREAVNTPMHTGIKSIDAMVPIGRGQRELLIGDRGIGKTSIALDAIINQKQDTKNRRPICIYTAIGQKESKVAHFIEKLRQTGAMEYSIVVSAPASSPASSWYLAPYTATAIGEYFMHKGEDVLIIYDDLTKQAWAYREMSLLLRRPPGREAYPGDIFYLHSRLLERSAKLNQKLGGGSITSIPIIETQLGDVSAYIPTNVISITDGQIYLEPELFYQGVRPAVNAGLSVSRVGSDAQTKAMKKVAGKLRLELAQFRELAAFAQFSSDLDESTKKRIFRGRVLTEILKQPELAPVPFEEQVAVIFAGTQGIFDEIPVEEVSMQASKLIESIKSLHPKIMEEIRTTGLWSEKIEEEMKNAIKDFGEKLKGDNK